MMKLGNKILSTSVLVAFAVSLTALSGCKKTPSCELLYKRLDKCNDDFGLKKNKFIKLCKKKKDRPIVKMQIACSKYASCDKFKKCLKDSTKKRAAERVKEELEKSIAAGKIKEALLTCKYSQKQMTDELKKQCAQLQVKQWDILKKKALEVRNSGGKNGWTVCHSLKNLADDLGDDAKKKEALGLCAEMDVSRVVSKALTKAKAEAAKPKGSVPFECDWGLNSLASKKVQTEWMKKQRNAIMDACYKKLGKNILEKWLAGKPRYCDFNATKVYVAVKKHGLADPAIKGLLDKAAKFCKKEFAKADENIAKDKAKKSGAGARPTADKKVEARK